MTRYPLFGLLTAILGALILSPDTLLMRACYSDPRAGAVRQGAISPSSTSALCTQLVGVLRHTGDSVSRDGGLVWLAVIMEEEPRAAGIL